MSKSSSLRADAARNRQRIVEVAREQFSKQNNSVTLEDIARRAEVGIGTLYRHFATREALIEAVYSSELDALMADGEALLKSRSAFQALRMWMDRYVTFVATKHAMRETISNAFTLRSGPLLETRSRMKILISRFLAAGIADHTIREDVQEDDLTVALAATVLAMNLASDEDQLRRVLDLLMEGLRPRT